MSDNYRLSSTQALEDYFVDLLVEPEPETEPAIELAPEPVNEPLPELAETEINEAETEKAETDKGPNSEPQDDELPSGIDPRQYPCVSQDVGLLAVRAKPQSKPFDFDSLDASPIAAPALDSLQRLLSQVSRPAAAPPDVEPVEKTQAENTIDDDGLADDWQQVMAHEQASMAVEAILPEPVAAELESTAAPATVAEPAPEMQASEQLPPDNWSQQIHHGDTFQALFFEVNGVTFAVPLTELGGIHQLGEVNHLLGRPPWYLGLMSSRERQLDVVDTACWVMPDKLDGEQHREQYRYVVVLGESKWGLACNTLLGTETLSENSVRWREKAGKRPWLAGMVKEKMCALIHVSELISMLKAGLDVNTKLKQS